MTPEDMSAKITTARATFSPLTGKPKYGNLVRLIKCITPILLRIPIKTVDGDINLWVMLSANAAYKARHCEVFYPPTRPVVYLTTPDYTTSVVRSHAKTVHKFLWCDFKLHNSAKQVCYTFIIDTVEDNGIHELQHTKIIYTDVTTKELVDHLQFHFRRLHTVDFVDLTSKIITYYGDAAGVLECINKIKDTQKKAQRA